MLIFALDDAGQLVGVSACQKGKDYHCPECKASVRLRSGEQRRKHFYHRENSLCRCSAVTLEHLSTQQWLLEEGQSHSLGQGHLEYWFYSINRIADLFFPSQGLVIEVQFSAISPLEVLARTLDYQSLGLEVIWILDFNRFVQEQWGEALFHIPHYYLAMERWKEFQNSSLPKEKNSKIALIDLVDDEAKSCYPDHLWRSPLSLTLNPSNDSSHLLWQRWQRWRIGFTGDWLESSQTTR